MRHRIRQFTAIMLTLIMICSVMTGVGAPSVKAEEYECIAEAVNLIPALENGSSWVNYNANTDNAGNTYINIPLTVPSGKRYAVRDGITWVSDVSPSRENTYQFKGINWSVDDASIVDLEASPKSGTADYEDYGVGSTATAPTSCVYLTPKAVGSTTLHWKSLDSKGLTGTVTVNVVQALPTAVTPGKAFAFRLAKAGDTTTISGFAVTPATAPQGFVYSTSSKTISVNQDGSIKALSNGLATVKVYARYANRSTSSSVKAYAYGYVGPIPINIAPSGLKKPYAYTSTMRAGDTAIMQYSEFGYSYNGYNTYALASDFTYTSLNPAVATVDNAGVIRAVSAGSAVITATAVNQGGDIKSFSNTVTVSGGSVTPSDTKVTGIALSPTSLNLPVNGTSRITATVSPSNATNPALTWSSGNDTVATVASDGTVTAHASGSAVITAAATDGSGITATCQVTVTNAATGIALSSNAVTLDLSKSDRKQATLTAIPQPAGADAFSAKVGWTSNNQNVATVADGVITAVGNGTAKVTASVRVNGFTKSAACTVTVKTSVTGITLSSSRKTLDLSKEDQKSAKLSATVSPQTASNQSVTWSSTNPAVAEVSADGTVTAKTSGNTQIIATAADGSGVTAACNVIVTTSANAVTLSETNITLAKKGTQVITATVLPADAADKTLTVQSNNTGIATVTKTVQGYQITGVAAGSTEIVFTANGNSSVTARCAVTVTSTKTTGITLNITGTKAMTVGDTVQLTASVTPADADDQTVSWQSENPDVAAVDRNGKLTAKAAGEATIYAKTQDGGASTSLKVTVAAKKVNKITVSAASNTTSLKTNAQVQLTATVTPANAANRNVTWKSSDPSLVSVSTTGLAKAVGNVTTSTDITITASAQDGSNVQGSITIHLIPTPLESFQITGGQVAKGGTLQLQAGNFTPATASNTTVSKWVSSNPTVAEVSATGQVSARNTGTTTITAYCGDKSAQCQVTVVDTAVPVTGLKVQPETMTVTKGEPFAIAATVTPSNATNQTLNWTPVAGTGAVSIQDQTDNHNVTFRADQVGEAQIQVVSAANSSIAKTIRVTVTPKYVTNVTLTASVTGKLKKGAQCQLTAAVTPTDATNSQLTWQSSDTTLATVDQNGTVSVVGDKTTDTSVTITASTNDGSGKSATYTIQIAARTTITVPVNTVKIVGDNNKTVTEGDAAFTVLAQVTPADATDQSLTWKITSGADIVSIVANGTQCTITPKKEGTAVIRVNANANSSVFATYVVTVKAKGSVHVHTYGKPTVIQQADCTSPEITRSICTCGAFVDQVTAQPLGHAYVDTVVAPTLETEGYTRHTCSRCHVTYDDQVVPKLQPVTPVQPSTPDPVQPGTEQPTTEQPSAGQTDTQNPTPQKVKVKKVTAGKVSVKKQKATITWKTDKTVSGYEITIATDKKFKKNVKKKTVSSAKKKSVQFKKLKKKTKYYVRIRSYKKVKGKKIYGKYSSTKTFKTK